MAPATASAASLINVATMAGPRTNEEKFIDIRWLSPADQPVRWLVGASMFEYESLSAQWFGYAGYLLGLEDELHTLWEADEKTSGQPSNVDDPWRFRSCDNELTKNIGIYGSVQWDISDRNRRHRPVQRLCNEPVAQLVIGSVHNSIQPDVGSK